PISALRHSGGGGGAAEARPRPGRGRKSPETPPRSAPFGHAGCSDPRRRRPRTTRKYRRRASRLLRARLLRTASCGDRLSHVLILVAGDVRATRISEIEDGRDVGGTRDVLEVGVDQPADVLGQGDPQLVGTLACLPVLLQREAELGPR